MSTLTSRILGVLAAIWTVHNCLLGARSADDALAWLLVPWALLWAITALALLLARRPRLAGGVLLAMSATDLAVLQQWHQYGVILIGWGGLILLALGGRGRDEKELTLCLRVLVTTVYVFGGLTKLQPSWLAGENMLYLARTRPQVAFLEGVPLSVLIVLGAAAALTELFIGIGLWTRARPYAAVVGVALHVTLVYAGTVAGIYGLLHLIVLNFGPVLLYVAFWRPIPKLMRPRPSGSLTTTTSPPAA